MAEIEGFLVDVQGGDRDAVLVMRRKGEDGYDWIGIDGALEPRWRLAVAADVSLHRRWFVADGVLSRLDAGGAITPICRVDADRVLAVLDDGFLVARGQRVRRVDRDGGALWSEPCTLPGNAREAHVSGDRVLVLTESLDYHAWGYLGPAMLLRLRDGAVRATLRGSRGAALDGERFLLTLEGYDLFDTWLHDRDGELVQQWRSSGHLVPDPTCAAIVIEQDRTSPTKSRVVRLHLDGTMVRGQGLDHGLSSAPLVLGDALVFVDGGRLREVSRDLRSSVAAPLHRVTPEDSWRFHAHVVSAGDHVIVALSERLAESEQPQMDGRTARDMRWRAHLFAITRAAAPAPAPR